jgi:hypothetical protein
MKILALIVFLLLYVVSVRAQWTEPVLLLGAINNDYNSKTWPSINSTGDTLYYAKIGTGGNEDICYSYLLADSTWSFPIQVSGSINTSGIEISPSIGPEDSILYFVTFGRAGGYGDFDIWYSRRGPDGTWMEPENPGPNINSSGMEWGVFISRDGQSLYFSSMRLHNGNELEILKSSWQGNGWGPAVPLPGNVNSTDFEENVTLPADESFLILTMARWYVTREDLWLSTFDGINWSTPVQIPELLGPRNEDGASLSPDGNTVFFSSQRNDSLEYKSDLYVSYRVSALGPNIRPLTHKQKFFIYPNPWQGGELSLLNHTEYPLISLNLSIFNVLGKCVYTNNYNGGTKTNLSEITNRLPSGKYWLNVKTTVDNETLPLILLK